MIILLFLQCWPFFPRSRAVVVIIVAVLLVLMLLPRKFAFNWKTHRNTFIAPSLTIHSVLIFIHFVLCFMLRFSTQRVKKNEKIYTKKKQNNINNIKKMMEKVLAQKLLITWNVLNSIRVKERSGDDWKHKIIRKNDLWFQ